MAQGVIMKNIQEILQILKNEMPSLSKKYQIKSLSVFGSYVRDEQNQNSDLDILVSFNEIPSLLEFMQLENYLSDLIGIQVDLVMEKSLKDKVSKVIIQEAVSI